MSSNKTVNMFGLKRKGGKGDGYENTSPKMPNLPFQLFIKQVKKNILEEKLAPVPKYYLDAYNSYNQIEQNMTNSESIGESCCTKLTICITEIEKMITLIDPNSIEFKFLGDLKANSLNLRGIVYFEFKKISEAHATFVRLCRTSRCFYEGFHNLGITYASVGDYSISIEYYDFALKCIDLIRKEKNLPQKQRKQSEKKKTFVEILASHFDEFQSDVLNSRGFARFQLHNFDLAIHDFKKSIEYNEINSAAYNNLGMALMNQGKHKRALRAINQCIGIQNMNDDEEIFESLNNRGLIYCNLNEKKKALSDFSMCIKLLKIREEQTFNNRIKNMKFADRLRISSPTSWGQVGFYQVYNNQALMYCRMGKYRKALKGILRCEKIYKRSVSKRTTGHRHHQSDNSEERMKMSSPRKGYHVSSDYVLLYLNMAEIYRKLLHLNHALRAIETFYVHLKNHKGTKQKGEEEVVVVEEQQHPLDGCYYYEKSRILLDMGRVREALVMVGFAIRLDKCVKYQGLKRKIMRELQPRVRNEEGKESKRK